LEKKEDGESLKSAKTSGFIRKIDSKMLENMQKAIRNWDFIKIFLVLFDTMQSFRW